MMKDNLSVSQKICAWPGRMVHQTQKVCKQSGKAFLMKLDSTTIGVLLFRRSMVLTKIAM